MQNIHPIFVHFPIALILSGFALDLFAILFKRPNLHIVGRWNLTLGFLGAVVAVLTGLNAKETVTQHSYDIHQLMETHKRIGILVLGLSAILTLLRWLAGSVFINRGKPLYFALSTVLVSLILLGAHYGGRMVYEYNVGGTAPTVTVTPH